MGRHLVLVGLMGSGKTTVGRLVADVLGRPFFDSDAQLLDETGRTSAEIAGADGVDRLHRMELDALATALGSSPPAVAAAAASVVVHEEGRVMLTDGPFVVFLDGKPEILASRIAAGPPRPWLDDDPLVVLEDMDRTRCPLYEAVADLVVDVEDVTPVEVAEEVVAACTTGGSSGPGDV